MPGIVLPCAFIRSIIRIFGAAGSDGSEANRLNRGLGRLCGKDILANVLDEPFLIQIERDVWNQVQSKKEKMKSDVLLK